EDSRAKVLLTQGGLSDKAGELFDGRVVVIEEAAAAGMPEGAIEDINRPDDLCYVIYTSGTTGRPKGVMVEHRNVTAYIHAFTKTTGVSRSDVLVEQHAFTFDAFAEGFFGGLLNGATLILPGKDQSQDLNGFMDLIKKNQGTMVFVSPLFLSEMNKMPPIASVHSYVCGGDILKWDYISHLSEGAVIYNNYGPTEATISSTIYKCQNLLGGVVPIGRPIANYKVVILDRWEKLNPVGIPGELCISGAGLARGYLGRPDLTGEKFTESPIWPGHRMYRTGDLARWMPDGNIQFIGRIDQQVKIRGYRIELGEIEALLSKHPAVRENAVLALCDEAGEKYLCAYICADQELTAVEMRKHLSDALPDHMIPQAYVQLDRLPLTAHGKLDRESLKKSSDRIRSGIEFQEPSTAAEKDIAGAWEKVLSLGKVSVNDDYFVLGGDSIKAVKLVSLLSDKYKVTLTDIFENRTVKKLADVLASRKHDLKQNFDRIRRETAEQDGDRNDRINRSLEGQAKKYRAHLDEETGLDIETRIDSCNTLLTGATGYLGMYILRELLEKSDSNITVLIRAGNNAAAEERLKKKWAHYFGDSLMEKDRARIRVLSGDLAAENLGLDPKEYQVLCQEIDCIIHSAAYTKHFGEYQAFYRGNIAATRNLLDLAKTGRRKVFNHISTTSVGSGSVQGREAVLFTEYLGDIGQQIDGYYVRSKLEAEKLVLAAGRQGLDFNIFRAGNLTFDSATGGFQENIGDNAFYIMLRSFIRLGIMPDLDIRNVDLTFVDQAAQAIVEMSGKKGLLNRCHHIMNDNYISVKDIAGRFAGNGIQIKVLPVPLFLDSLEEKSRDERHRDDVSNILIHSNLLEESQTTYFDVTCIGTSAILKRLGFRWEEPGLAQFAKMLTHCRKVRFI
ncbi:amino acid adenylation domain-containing protein, partial [candidate division TA06 bacterium]|nr:amino acid adenylation domain-containing protein [candidate division TA06 bacterium]